MSYFNPEGAFCSWCHKTVACERIIIKDQGTILFLGTDRGAHKFRRQTDDSIQEEVKNEPVYVEAYSETVLVEPDPEPDPFPGSSPIPSWISQGKLPESIYVKANQEITTEAPA